MLPDSPLSLSVARVRDFAAVVGLFFMLAGVSAALSPQPGLAILPVLLLLGSLWLATILGFYKIDKSKLTLVIFQDGRVKLKSDVKESIEGFLDGQQWCTHRVAVLRVSTGDTTHKLVVLFAQQSLADEFRCLNMWLRQNDYSDSEDRQVSHV